MLSILFSATTHRIGKFLYIDIVREEDVSEWQLTVYFSHVSVRGVSGHSFFPEPDRPCLSLGGGLELWHGYHQSIRHSQMWKPILNIDVANTAFYKEQGGNIYY